MSQSAAGPVQATLVTHTHWDREWYRTFQAFRARLVDAVDKVLNLLARDPGYFFVLDGQAIVLEDYVAVRPDRRAELEKHCAEGRLGIGPWYVQPDMLLPSGEAHVRNLLEGRRVASAYGPVSKVGYAPDCFGHPAQMPQVVHGFGLDTYVYWRGNGSEIDDLPPRYAWIAPDGTAVTAHHLRGSYSGAGSLSWDFDEALAVLVELGEKHVAEGADRILLMNGNDHTLPEERTGELAAALAERTGWNVRRGLLDDVVLDAVDPSRLPGFTGDLLGGRVANLLPGVWSTRTYLKVRNRRCESLLEGWAEPWVAFGTALGLPDERPALRIGWRALIPNQAHDSICGCSVDAVHDQMLSRYAEASELAAETTNRVLERIAGVGPERLTPWSDEVDIAVFNPMPFPVTDVVRLPIDGFPPYMGTAERFGVHPLLDLSFQGRIGLTIDGTPARLMPDDDARFRLIPEHRIWAAEFVATDVPAFGWKRMHLAPAEPKPDDTDDGRSITADDVSVTVADDGTLTVVFGGTTWRGLFTVEDVGDRGDTYDFDPVPDGSGARVSLTAVRRRRHVSGIERLHVELAVDVPRGLTEDRSARSAETTTIPMTLEARVARGVRRVDVTVTFDNTATDHRLRLLFPTSGGDTCRAATTFGVSTRRAGRLDDTGWQHQSPSTWPAQGWVASGGLAVVAPGLNEAELLPDGVVAVTALRCVGWLSRWGLVTRPEPAGPGVPTPGAQCPGPLTVHVSLLPDGPELPAQARAAELGLRAAVAGPAPLVDDGTSLLRLEPAELVLSALKPADDGDGVVVRVLNPTDDGHAASLRFGLPVASVEAVRLDETASDDVVSRSGDAVEVDIPGHGLRSLRVRFA